MTERLKNLAPIRRLREKGREERAKIRKIVIKRKDDMLTALEKNWRDWSLRPLTRIFRVLGIRANHITYVGFLLIGFAIWGYFKNYDFIFQFLILVLAAISDAIDGPTARNNDDVTVLGTWLDHIRDGLLVAWASFLIYGFGLLSGELILTIWMLQLLLVWISVKDFLIRYLRGLSAEEERVLIDNFSLDNLQASLIGRLQFVSWTLGYGSLFLYLLFPDLIFMTVGQTLIILEIIFAALNISDAYQKSV